MLFSATFLHVRLGSDRFSFFCYCFCIIFIMHDSLRTLQDHSLKIRSAAEICIESAGVAR